MSHVSSQVVTWTRLEWQRHHVEHEDAIMAKKKKSKKKLKRENVDITQWRPSVWQDCLFTRIQQRDIF